MLVHAATFAGPSMSPSAPPPPVHHPVKSALLSKLESAISTLPASVLVGTKEDDLAQFSGDPIHSLEEGDDTWEVIDKALNRVIGYGKTAAEIENIIRRGQYGMDGMLIWLKKCVYTLEIDESLLENKIERLIGAMLQL